MCKISVSLAGGPHLTTMLHVLIIVRNLQTCFYVSVETRWRGSSLLLLLTFIMPKVDPSWFPVV